MSEMSEKDFEKKVWECLATVIDPELLVDIVGLGLIYEVKVKSPQKTLLQGRQKSNVKNTSNSSKSFVENRSVHQRWQVKITMTLTTPGCPLAGTFRFMVWDSLRVIPDLNPEEDVEVELTFDPPWVPDLMSEEVKAELGMGEW